MDLGRTIALMRKQKNLKQWKLAERCGISPAYLSQIENNRKDPNLSVLKDISREIDVPLPILFFLSLNEDDIPERKREAFALLSPPVKALVREIFSGIPKDLVYD